MVRIASPKYVPGNYSQFINDYPCLCNNQYHFKNYVNSKVGAIPPIVLPKYVTVPIIFGQLFVKRFNGSPYAIRPLSVLSVCLSCL